METAQGSKTYAHADAVRIIDAWWPLLIEAEVAAVHGAHPETSRPVVLGLLVVPTDAVVQPDGLRVFAAGADAEALELLQDEELGGEVAGCGPKTATGRPLDQSVPPLGGQQGQGCLNLAASTAEQAADDGGEGDQVGDLEGLDLTVVGDRVDVPGENVLAREIAAVLEWVR
ncbi:hypothetical protein BCL76_11346 [Streptomyces sp. CG 926]|nr:hypothetical protein BCL76_11346 [Streptomyces sp. CG 926]